VSGESLVNSRLALPPPSLRHLALRRSSSQYLPAGLQIKMVWRFARTRSFEPSRENFALPVAVSYRTTSLFSRIVYGVPWPSHRGAGAGIFFDPKISGARRLSFRKAARKGFGQA